MSSHPSPRPFNELGAQAERRLRPKPLPPVVVTPKRLQGLCFWCGNRRATTNDHVLPRIKGGRNEPENKVRSCELCNRTKGGMHPATWVANHVPAHRKPDARALLWRLETWYGERWHSPQNPVTGLGAVRGEA